MAFRRVLVLCVVCVLALCAGQAAAAEHTVNRVVAVVGDDIITTMDLDKVMKLMESQLEPAGSVREAADRRRQMRKVAIERLIEDKLFAQEVARQGLKVSDKDIDNYLVRLKKSNRLNDEQFAAQLSRRGLTPKEYRDDLRKDMLKHKLIAQQVKSKVVISDEQVKQFYQKHIAEYRKGDKVRIRALFRTMPGDAAPATREAVKEKTQDLRRQVEGGGDLAALAKQYSQGPGAPQGGEIGPVAASDLLPAMRQALGSLKTGQLSPVLELPGGYVFFKLLARTGTQVEPLDKVREDIRNKLQSDALEKKFQEWMKNLRAKTYVKVID